MDKLIPKNDFIQQLKLRAVPVTGNVVKTGEENIPLEMAEMRREMAEKKLLQYQIRNKRTINDFLKSKYSDGNFNEAVIDGYDNTETRLKNGIAFEYHVYFEKTVKPDGTDLHLESRPNNHYFVSNELVDYTTGDSYFYHLPVYYSENSLQKQLKTDLDGELINLSGLSESKNGLVHALNTLSSIIKESKTSVDSNVNSILKRHGFINPSGKLQFAIEKNLLVEKYLKSIKSDTKHNAIVYLNKFYEDDTKKEEETKYDTVTETLPKKSNNSEILRAAKQIKATFKETMKELDDYKDLGFSEKINALYKQTVQEMENDGDILENKDTIIANFSKKVTDLKTELDGEIAETKKKIDDKYAEFDKDGVVDIDYKIKLEDIEDYVKSKLQEIDDKKAEAEKIKEEQERAKKIDEYKEWMQSTFDNLSELLEEYKSNVKLESLISKRIGKFKTALSNIKLDSNLEKVETFKVTQMESLNEIDTKIKEFKEEQEMIKKEELEKEAQRKANEFSLLKDNIDLKKEDRNKTFTELLSRDVAKVDLRATKLNKAKPAKNPIILHLPIANKNNEYSILQVEISGYGGLTKDGLENLVTKTKNIITDGLEKKKLTPNLEAIQFLADSFNKTAETSRQQPKLEQYIKEFSLKRKENKDDDENDE